MGHHLQLASYSLLEFPIWYFGQSLTTVTKTTKKLTRGQGGVHAELTGTLPHAAVYVPVAGFGQVERLVPLETLMTHGM